MKSGEGVSGVSEDAPSSVDTAQPAASERTINEVRALVGKHPGGLRAEQIRKELGLVAKELPRPLAEGLAAKRLAKKGQKRATTYFAGSGGGKARAKRRAKK
jgi:hypothetical protein